MERNSFLVSHAFRNYLRASLLNSFFIQLTVVIDAIVAAHCIGPDAMTAINLVLPLTTFVAALSSLIGLGPAIMAAKAIGRRNTEMVNSIYSSAMYQAIFFGIINGIILYLFLPQVSNYLCLNEHLLPYLKEYLQILPISFMFIMIVTTMSSLIEADGHPNFATKGVALGSLLNVILDLVLVKFFEIGVQGLALAMMINYLSVFLFYMLRMKSEGISYKWSRPRRHFIRVTLSGLKEGMPIMLNDLIYSLMLFGINSLLLKFYGESELYVWAIFIQLLLFVLVIVDSAEGAILSIGSVLKGEDDRFGLRALIHRSWMLVGIIVLIITITTSIFPNKIVLLFSNQSDIPDNIPNAIRILSLMLIPYSLFTFMRSVFQVLGEKLCAIFFSIGMSTLIIVGLYLSSSSNSLSHWWSFPVTAWILFAVQLLYLKVFRKRKQKRDLSVSQESSNKIFLELSVEYNLESLKYAIQQVCTFLQKNNVNQLIEMEVNICCEELMNNIVMFQTYKTRSYMDLTVVLEDHRIFFVLKDSGRPFNPIIRDSDPELLENDDVQLGLFLVNRVSTTLSHKYMYGLNVVFAEFDKYHDVSSQKL